MTFLVVATIAMLPLLVQGVTCVVLVGEFTWPNADLPTALLGLTHGHFGSGLPQTAADALPPDPVMWVLTGVVEMAVLGGSGFAGLRLRDMLAPAARHGLATSSQAAEALGIKALHSKIRVIRPDLGRPHDSSRTGTARLRRFQGRWLGL